MSPPFQEFHDILQQMSGVSSYAEETLHRQGDLHSDKTLMLLICLPLSAQLDLYRAFSQKSGTMDGSMAGWSSEVDVDELLCCHSKVWRLSKE